MSSKNLDPTSTLQTNSAQLMFPNPNPKQTCWHRSKSALTLVWSWWNQCLDINFFLPQILFYQLKTFLECLFICYTNVIVVWGFILFLISSHHWVLIFLHISSDSHIYAPIQIHFMPELTLWESWAPQWNSTSQSIDNASRPKFCRSRMAEQLCFLQCELCFKQ